jgi:drug/metabolite transporter (DMT)-like permease
MISSLSRKARVVIAFACVYFFWGSTYGVIRIAGLHLAPPLIGAIRSLIATALIVALCMARGTSLRVPWRAAWRLALIGVLIMTVNNVLLIWAETMVATGYASLVVAMIPIMVALLETSLPGGETLNLRGWLGTLLGALGMLALLWPALHRGANSGANSRSLLGFALLVAAALAFSIGSVASRRFDLPVDTFVSTAWQIGAAGLLNLIIAIGGGCFQTAQWTTSGVLSILYLAVFGTVVGMTAYTYLIQNVPVTEVSTYAFVNPVIAVLIGVALFHERLASSEVLGMVLVIAAVTTVILSRSKNALITDAEAPA